MVWEVSGRIQEGPGGSWKGPGGSGRVLKGSSKGPGRILEGSGKGTGRVWEGFREGSKKDRVPEWSGLGEFWKGPGRVQEECRNGA